MKHIFRCFFLTDYTDNHKVPPVKTYSREMVYLRLQESFRTGSMFSGINNSFKQDVLDLEKQLGILNTEPCDFPKATVNLMLTMVWIHLCESQEKRQK